MCMISIIVPVYNVEKYLHKCVDSILSQTFSDIEVILVDDGSTDKSGEICDQYVVKDQRIRVIHKKNGGLSSARNIGLDIAVGRYIGFVDSDDYIANDMYEILYDQLIESNADLSCVGMIDVYENRTSELKQNKIIELVDQKQAIKLVVDGKDIFAYAVNKLYKRDLFNDIRYPEGKIVEDAFIIIDLLLLCERIVINSEQKYFYYRRNDSITGASFSGKNLDIIEAWTRNEKLVNSYFLDLENETHRRLCWAYFFVLDKIVIANQENVYPGTNEIIQFLKENKSFILKYPGFTKSRKIAIICLSINLKLYKYLAVKQEEILNRKHQ
ncbi:glycosyltransferase family 2 protein [Candidatus Enterococcus lemimoniae]|uniref:Glycosyltransferase 2-like domain-containing protein n=1 Tax=Candidatus Enterococcus lemimoniae TaxID=1834167 RepID=A0ABZ2T973_9ENTE